MTIPYRSNPSVIIFPLPERFSCLAEYPVGTVCGRCLQPPHNLRQLCDGLQHHMNMIRHYHPRDEIIVAANRFSMKKRFDEDLRDLGILEPAWTILSLVQFPILQHERSARFGGSQFGRLR